MTRGQTSAPRPGLLRTAELHQTEAAFPPVDDSYLTPSHYRSCVTVASQHRLATRCRACGELFWVADAPSRSGLTCPVCARPVSAPAGRFDGIRSLVAFVMELGPTRHEH